MKKINWKDQIELSVFVFLFSVFAVIAAEAHGDDMPGPHGGKIQMPGPFHTEVLAQKDGFKVYLLDMNFEKPVVKDSDVQASLKVDNKTTKIVCQKHTDHFFCPVAKVPKTGKFIIKATRDSVKGNEAEYTLPMDHVKK